MRKSKPLRLLATAAVVCTLLASLTGCTKEEFIAGYNEFMHGDWIGAIESPASSPTLYYSSADQERISSSGHVYDPPNEECDAIINSLLSELYSLESSARSDVSAAIQATKDEYHALPASQQNMINKYSIAYSHLSAVESTYDSEVSSIVSQMRSTLQEYNQPETVADDAWSYYQSAKSSMISSLS